VKARANPTLTVRNLGVLMGGFSGSRSFVLSELARRLNNIEIWTVSVEHYDFDDGDYVLSIAGFGRDKKCGSKMFYGFTVWTHDGHAYMNGYTCAFKSLKDLIIMATEPYVPHIEFPDWVALALHKTSPFELFDSRKRIEESEKKTTQVLA